MRPDLFPVSAGRDQAGRLQIAGFDLRDLAAQFGTPLYLYDAATIQHQAGLLSGLLNASYPAAFDITYAAKAYFSLGMARKLAALNLGVDVVSLSELAVAQAAGFSADRVHLHGNNKSAEELTFALKWGVQAIVVDSLEELSFLESLAARAGTRARIWLRITPGVSVDTHRYVQTAHHASKFGLSIAGGQAAQGIRRALASQHVTLTGLHTHLGSQFFQAEPYREAIGMLLDLAGREGFIPEELSPGGGWGVPYTDQADANDPHPWVETVCKTVIEAYNRRGWRLPKLLVEPGRWMVARAGVALYTIGTTKQAGDGTFFVAVDGGLADNPRPALYQAQYSACLVERPDAPGTVKSTIAGKFCESGDQLIEGVMLPEVERGDLLAIPVGGAYQLSMASNYNLAARPAVLWLDAGHLDVLQKRETPHTGGWWMGD